MQSVERADTEAGLGGGFPSCARACPMRGGKAPSGAGGGGAGSASTGGAGLHFSIFSRSQATPPVLAPSFWDRPCVPAGDHFPTPHPPALWWNMVLGLCSCTAGGKLAAGALGPGAPLSLGQPRRAARPGGNKICQNLETRASSLFSKLLLLSKAYFRRKSC